MKKQHNRKLNINREFEMNSQLRRVSGFASPFCLPVFGYWLALQCMLANSLLTDIFKLTKGENIKRTALPKIPSE